MSLKLEIINPLVYPDWDKLVLSTPDYSFFHSSNWARVLSEAYGYKPLYFTEINNRRLKTLFPFMEVKSILTGKRAVSLPFSDYWKSMEIKSGNNLPVSLPSSTYYYLHTLNCSRNQDQIFSAFRGSTKRNIKKAIREGISIEISHSPEAVREFTKMNCLTRKKHGLPPQPSIFFKKVHEHIIANNLGFVILASYNKKIIAGAIFFYFGNKALFKYGASDLRYQHLRPNNLIMWEAIKWFAKNGYQSLCFGRTEPANKGLLQFKRGWGSEEHSVSYYKFNLKNNTFITDSDMTYGIFRKMPTSLLKITGSLLYKHMG